MPVTKEFLRRYKIAIAIAGVLILAVLIGAVSYSRARRTNTNLKEQLALAEEESRQLDWEIEDLEEELRPENESQLKMDEALDNGYAPRDYEPYNVEH